MWAHLLDSVQSGQPAFPQLHQGQSIWEWRAAHPNENTFFNRAQHADTRLRAHALLAAYDFGQFPTVADLGGGTGAFLAALLAHYPGVRGLLFDQPHVVAAAAPALERAGVAARCAVMGGSFFDAIPSGYAAYILKAVLNSFNDTTRLAILRRVRTVCTTDTRLLVLEDVIGPPNEDPYTKMLDLAMMLRTGGAQYTREAWAALFAAGGFASRASGQHPWPLRARRRAGRGLAHRPGGKHRCVSGARLVRARLIPGVRLYTRRKEDRMTNTVSSQLPTDSALSSTCWS